MSEYSPPRLSGPWIVAIVVPYVLFVSYTVVILRQPLLGTVPGLVFGVAYLIWRFLAAIEAIAAALHRIAHQLE